jgi:hypothetical protein
MLHILSNDDLDNTVICDHDYFYTQQADDHHIPDQQSEAGFITVITVYSIICDFGPLNLSGILARRYLEAAGKGQG